MIDRLLGDRVAAVEAFSDIDAAAILDGERAAMHNASPARQREFATGRECARLAMRLLGRNAVAVPSGTDGAPEWPAGMVGSITHCSGYRAAALASTADFIGIGIDAEPHRALPGDARAAICSPNEIAQARALSHLLPGIHLDRLVFSAKEAVFKSWFPLNGQFLEFAAAEIELRPGQAAAGGIGRFSAYVNGGGHQLPAELQGRWLIDHDLMVTVVTIPAIRA